MVELSTSALGGHEALVSDRLERLAPGLRVAHRQERVADALLLLRRHLGGHDDLLDGHGPRAVEHLAALLGPRLHDGVRRGRADLREAVLDVERHGVLVARGDDAHHRRRRLAIASVDGQLLGAEDRPHHHRGNRIGVRGHQRVALQVLERLERGVLGDHERHRVFGETRRPHERLVTAGLDLRHRHVRGMHDRRRRTPAWRGPRAGRCRPGRAPSCTLRPAALPMSSASGANLSRISLGVAW